MGRKKIKAGVLRGPVAVLLLVCVALVQAISIVRIVERDYSANHVATDRFWFYKKLDGSPQDPANEGGPLPGGGVYNPLEMQIGRSYQIPGVVYTRASNLTLRLRFQNLQIEDITADLKFSAIRIAVPAYYEQRPDVTYIDLIPPADQEITIPGLTGTVDVFITITGVPDYVTLGDIEVKVTLEAISGRPPGENVLIMGPAEWWPWERLYLTESTPEDLQAQPWTELLDLSCSRAHGESEVEAVTNKNTDGLFWGPIFAYNLGTAGIPFRWRDQATGKYKLKPLIDAVAASGKQDGSCVDVSYFLELALEGLGIVSQCNRLYYTQPIQYGFITNLMCPIGSDATNPSLYWHVAFGMHQQCYVDGKVNDAAVNLRKDLTGAYDVDPPSWWPMPDYWQKSPGPIIPPEIYGLVYRELLSTDTLYDLIIGGKVVSQGVIPDASVPPRLISHVGPNIVNHNGIK